MKNLIKSSFIGSLLFTVSLLFSCKKEMKHGNISGNNSIVYESDYMYQYKFRPLSIGNTYIIKYHLDVYSDVVGRVSILASGGKTNGKADWFKDIEISNLKLVDDVKISLSGSNLNFSNDLINCKLIYSYYPIDNSGKKTKILATFNGYSPSEGKVSLSSSGENLINLFKENPDGNLYLEFSFTQNAAADQYANLGYSVAFHYDYSYTTMESKK